LWKTTQGRSPTKINVANVKNTYPGVSVSSKSTLRQMASTFRRGFCVEKRERKRVLSEPTLDPMGANFISISTETFLTRLWFCKWFSEAMHGGEVDPVQTSCTADEIT